MGAVVMAVSRVRVVAVVTLHRHADEYRETDNEQHNRLPGAELQGVLSHMREGVDVTSLGERVIWSRGTCSSNCR